MPIWDSGRRNEQIMPDHDGRHCRLRPVAARAASDGATAPPVSPARANTQRDWETHLLMWPAD
jgi:hypothetical protein